MTHLVWEEAPVSTRDWAFFQKNDPETLLYLTVKSLINRCRGPLKDERRLQTPQSNIRVPINSFIKSIGSHQLTLTIPSVCW